MDEVLKRILDRLDPDADHLTLSRREALETAVLLHQAGRLLEAEAIYWAVLQTDPSNADAMHFLGVGHYQRGDAEAALELIRASLANAPDNAGAWSNLGNVLRGTGDLAGAEEAYREALRREPGNAAALNNLGVVLKGLDRPAEAEEALRRAVAADPEDVEAWHNLAHLLRNKGDRQGALEAFERAVELRPDGAAYRNLSYSLYQAGQLGRAVEIVREWLAHDPENPVAAHFLAAFSGENVPARAADGYVRGVFDSFAEVFDAKLRSLDYRAPELVEEAVRRAAGEPRAALAVLDAGCGTGLCGPLLRPYASRLAGVDLSGGMLERARSRGVYDDLAEAELTEHLRRRRGAFDLVVSADTLCYFGDLSGFATAAAGALRPGGRVVFTVEDAGEAAPPAGYKLQPHGRYAHAEGYVRSVLRLAGLEVAEAAPVILRKEGGEPVSGLLVTGRKPGPSSVPGAS